MPPSRKTVFLMGVRGQCPRCGGENLFQSPFRLYPNCPACGLPIEKEDGWGLGAIPLNYAITCVFWVLPVAILFMVGVFTLKAALVTAGIGCLVIPFLTYRFSKRLWLGIYFAVLPHELDEESGY